MSNEKQQPKKTAAQRLSNLEDTLVGTLKALGAVDNEQSMIKEALSLLGAKLDAMTKLLQANNPQLTDAAMSNLMIEGKANKMSADTQQAVSNGVLVSTDVVTENCFVVGREVEDNGNVINPRIQFTVESAKEQFRARILGAKVLDRILVEEGKAKLELLEIYSINQPKAPEQSAPAQA